MYFARDLLRVCVPSVGVNKRVMFFHVIYSCSKYLALNLSTNWRLFFPAPSATIGHINPLATRYRPSGGQPLAAAHARRIHTYLFSHNATSPRRCRRIRALCDKLLLASDVAGGGGASGGSGGSSSRATAAERERGVQGGGKGHLPGFRLCDGPSVLGLDKLHLLREVRGSMKVQRKTPARRYKT